MQCNGIAPAARWIGILIALVLSVGPASPAAAETERTAAAERILIPSASWQGRPIRQPHDHPVRTSAGERPPRGWEAGPVAMGTGLHRPDGSQRVRELQRRLRALGYRPGPVDGIFGPRTRAAVAWFQVKHGFRVNGRATLAVVRHLRDRTTPGAPRTQERRAETAPDHEASSGAAYRDLVVTPPATSAADSGDDLPFWALAGLMLLAFAVGFAAVAMVLWRRPGPGTGTGLARTPRALGYMCVDARVREGVEAEATAIEGRCAEHGMALAGVVTDEAGDTRAGGDRPGLAFALEKLHAGEADCLVLGRLDHLTRSPTVLMDVVDTLEAREVPLVVLNAGPASTRPDGRWQRAGRLALVRRAEVPDG